MEMTPHIEAETLRRSIPQPITHLGRRRLAFFSLFAATVLLLLAGLTAAFLEGGFSMRELGMIVLFALNLPWIVTGFWNAVIGVVLLRLSRDGRRMLPLAGAVGQTAAAVRARRHRDAGAR